jgi:hypothetical protein
MSQRSEEEVLLRNYLLGGLNEATREQLEERLLCDDDFAERLSAAQDDLIDDYVFEALSEGERASFDKNFIIDEERRRKMRFVQAMEIYVGEHEETQPRTRVETLPPLTPTGVPLSFFRTHKAWITVSAFVLLLLFFTPAILRRLRTPDQAALLRERRASIERQVAELNRPPEGQSVQSLPAFELALQPSRLREDGGLQRATLTNDVKLLALKLSLPQVRHENYSAVVLTVEGEELFAVNNLKSEVDAGLAAVRLNIPTEFLATSDYQIQLRAVAADGSSAETGRYSFRVIKN